MALVLDVLKSDISLRVVFSWLQNGSLHEVIQLYNFIFRNSFLFFLSLLFPTAQELKEILKSDVDEARHSFAFLLSAFIREKSARFVSSLIEF